MYNLYIASTSETRKIGIKKMKTEVSISALCALMNNNIDRNVNVIDLKLKALEAAINVERSESAAIYCGMGGEWDALMEERSWILEGFYAIEDGEIVWDAPCH